METKESWVTTIIGTLDAPENRLLISLGLTILTINFAVRFGESIGKFIYHITH